ncbi:MAG: alpha-glucosidase [Lachnospiraceae bacterium]|nr:alpha-glucosidase [Lachnospiraceae bacterium]
MYKKLILGDPIDTEAILCEVPAETTESSFTGVEKSVSFLKDFTICRKGLETKPAKENTREACTADEPTGEIILTRTLRGRELVYGLGETLRGINKRGWIYVSNNADDPNHTEDKRSLYASQNFLLLFGDGAAQALFVDVPGKVTFDVGYSELKTLEIRIASADAALYYAESEDPLLLIREFRSLIGRSYQPPQWAFGFGQSRWGYKTAADIREVADRYAEAGIPLSMIYLDIDYMDHYKDFTIDEKAFPDFPDFVAEMKERGIRLIPIIDAGVKMEKGYPVYEEGVKGDFFCKKEDGTDLVAAVWPGRVHFPDFLKKETRDWFGEKYRFLTEQGIEGFWNDMNEPAIFYTEDHLREVFEELDRFKEMEEMDIWSFFAFQDLTGSINNRPEDYRTFFHEYKGQRLRHDQVHNLYGYYMTRAAGEKLRDLVPGGEYLLFSRASYVGMHRYGGIWTGDNKSWWSHLLLNLQQLPALNMCGFLFCGADTGGFGGDCTEDLMLRWLAVSIFTPLFRNHAALGTRNQELYRFEQTDTFRNLIRLRYALIPYLYDTFTRAAEENDLIFTPLALAYPSDERARTVEDQLLVGEALMIAPVYTQNAAGRYVYLPEDMTLYRFRSVTDYDVIPLTAGDHYVSLATSEVAIYVRPGYSLEVSGEEFSITAN